MEKAKVEVVAAFFTSQPYFDECSDYYGDGFDDCLKRGATVYLDLDLSQVVIDDTVPPTLGGVDAANDETDDSIHTVVEEVNDPDAEVVVQFFLEGPAAPEGLSIADGPSIKDQSPSKAPPS